MTREFIARIARMWEKRENFINRIWRWFCMAALIGGAIAGFTVPTDESRDKHWHDFYEKGDPNDIGNSMFRYGYADCLENKRRLYQGG